MPIAAKPPVSAFAAGKPQKKVYDILNNIGESDLELFGMGP